MKNVSRCFGANLTLNSSSSKVCQFLCEKYSTAAAYKTDPKERREKHPYKKIHPWNSFKEFSESLLENVIYNNSKLIFIECILSIIHFLNFNC